MGNLKKLNSYKQRVKHQLPTAGYGGNRVILVKRYKLSVISIDYVLKFNV